MRLFENEGMTDKSINRFRVDFIRFSDESEIRC